VLRSRDAFGGEAKKIGAGTNVISRATPKK